MIPLGVTQWIRAGEFDWKGSDRVKTTNWHLFWGGDEPNDIIQGNLDNCWLLAMISALGEFGYIRKNTFKKMGEECTKNAGKLPEDGIVVIYFLC